MISEYYQQTSIWDMDPSVAQLDVANMLEQMIPQEVQSLLDSGCGNGVVTNRLAERWDAWGCDISSVALKHVKAPHLVADLIQLPFVDHQFDLVLASDVLEHIPTEYYKDAVSEIARVARSYILIAVPFGEILEASTVVCRQCGARYHAHYHQRSYAAQDFEGLFPPNFEIVDLRLAGARWAFSERFVSRVALEMGGIDYESPSAVCPQCGFRRGTQVRPANLINTERRLSALQYLRCENELCGWPTLSELLVLLKRGRPRQSANRFEFEHSSPPERQSIQISNCVQLTYLVNYPLQPYLIGDPVVETVLVLPRLPRTIRFQSHGSTISALSFFDAVLEEYFPLEGELDGDVMRFAVPAIRPAIWGYRIKLLGDSSDLELGLEYPTKLDAAECFLRAFYDSPVECEAS